MAFENLYMDDELEFEDDAYKVYAMRDIEPGEELTSDYTQTKGLKQPKPDWK